MDVGHAIRLCRTQRGTSQSELAELAHCSASYLSMLENNKRDPTVSTLTRIAKALRVPVGALFFLASSEADLGKIDKRVLHQFERSLLKALDKPSKNTASG